MKIKNYIKQGFLFVTMAMVTFQSCTKKDPAVSGELQPDEMTGYMADQKGMKLTYTITEGDGLGSRYLLEVTDTKDSAGYKVASARLTFNGNIFIYNNGKYNREKTISIGGNMPALYYQLLDKMKEQFNVSFTHEERPSTLVIPHQNPINQVVSPQTTLANWHGVGEDEYSKITHEYAVKRSAIIIDTAERIQIGLGEFDCLRLHFVSSSHNKIVITDKTSNSAPQTFINDFDSDVTVWIAPGLGTVKTTEVNSAGISTTALTNIEK